MLTRNRFTAQFKGIDHHAESLHAGCCEDFPVYQLHIEVFAENSEEAKKTLFSEFYCGCAKGEPAQTKCLDFSPEGIIWKDHGPDAARRTGILIHMFRFLKYAETEQ